MFSLKQAELIGWVDYESIMFNLLYARGWEMVDMIAHRGHRMVKMRAPRGWPNA